LNKVLRNNLAALTPLARQKADKGFFEKTCGGALDRVGEWIFERDVNLLFEKALEYRDVTAWICATDQTALHALEFLRKRKIQVPVDLSVVGFDNIPVQALENRLTTLDFNAMGFIHHMLNFIIRTPRPRGPYQHSPIEVEGIIMERETTGRINSK
jgi:DNA-binding LacI/PurR family transcriptional regulator